MTDIVFKSCGNYIVTMKKLLDTITTEGRSSIINAETASYRANKLEVINIQNKDNPYDQLNAIENDTYDIKVKYVVGEIALPDCFWYDLEDNNMYGIHYFLSKECAYYFRKLLDGKKGTHGFRMESKNRNLHFRRENGLEKPLDGMKMGINVTK